MANPRSLMFMLSLTLFLATLSFSVGILDDKSSIRPGAGLIEATCKNTSSYDICVSSFKSNPKSFEADVLGLLRISIDLADLNATGVLSYIDNLIKSSKDVSASVKSCREDYQGSLYARDRAIVALGRGDYLSTNIDISAAFSYTDNCQLEFTLASSSSSVGLEELPAELTQMNDVMLKLDSISLGILCGNFMKCPGSPAAANIINTKLRD